MLTSTPINHKSFINVFFNLRNLETVWPQVSLDKRGLFVLKTHIYSSKNHRTLAPFVVFVSLVV